MSSVIQTTFVLTGALAGKSINLGSQGYPFREGKLTINATPEETALHARFLQRNWQAYPKGHPKLEEVIQDGQRDIPPDHEQDEQPPVQGGSESEGEGTEAGVAQDEGTATTEPETGDAGTVSNGDGQPEELNAKLLKAVQSLDPKDDSHWTKDGKPAMTAVEKLYGAADVTRADVEAVAPGFTRPTE